MNDADQRKEFASAIENEFLPTIVKPGRYISAEWVCPSESEVTDAPSRPSAAEEPLPIAVIVGLKSYERSVNEPLFAATRLALLDSGRFGVGMTYAFGADALETLKDLKLEPFSSPDFAALNQADFLIIPLKNWAELAVAPGVLQAAAIPLSKARRSQRKSAGGFPRLVAVIEDDVEVDFDATEGERARQSAVSTVPSIVTDIFDSVLSLSAFLSAPAWCLEESCLKKQGGGGAKVPPGPLLPKRPVVSPVEVSQPRARFGFRKVSVSESAEISAALSENIRLSGLTEIELEGCANTVRSTDSTGVLGEIIDTLARQIDAHRYALSLRDLCPAQVTPLLSGALARFRRVRVELSAPSLSSTALASVARRPNFAREQFVASLAQLQIEPLQSLHLRVELGYPVDLSIEAQETVETMQACAGALNPRRGLRVKFERYRSRFSPIHEERQIHTLFEELKRRARIKGVTYSLEDAFPTLFGALIDRDAFGSTDELEALVESSQGRSDTRPAESSLRAAYADILARGHRRQPGENREPQTSEFGSIKRSRQRAEANSGSTTVEKVTVKQQSSFGRRKKRTGAMTVSAPTRTRLRFTWSVCGPARFLSHLDNIRAIEATLLRSRLALAYTQGQRPRLKISFGAPKPVGFTSECELFDAYFETAPSESAITRLDSLLPPGYRIVSASRSLTKELSILESIRHATYLVGLKDERLSDALAGALARNRLLITRQGKKRERQIDLRPGIYEARILRQSDSDYASYFNFGALEPSGVDQHGAGKILKLTLALTDTFYVRPEEFLAVAGILTREESRKVRIHRLRFGCNAMQPLPTESAQVQNLSGA